MPISSFSRRRKVAAGAVAVLLGAGSLLLGASPRPVGPGGASVRIDGVPHVHQKPDFCGEAVVAAWLGRLGFDTDQDAVFDLTGVDPTQGRGAWTGELVRAVRALGFEPGAVWSTIAADRPEPGLDAAWRALHADLEAGVPSIVCTRYDASPDTTEHFRLVLGYDAAADEVLFHEPALERGAYRRMGRAELLSLWPLRYAADTWTLVRIRLAGAPARSEVPPASTSLTDADYAQAVQAVRAQMPRGRGFTMVVERPFVVVGDGGLAEVRRWATGTVRWAVQRLKARYFTADPDVVLTVWLFKDTESYDRHVPELFGHAPSTPFGYYSRRERALVMNISTGGGTLVHEIVHPYVEANFPAARAWFNEGLGSLYEQSGERDGGIVGRTNWRLAGLQQAIREGRVPSFHTLVHTTDAGFYDADPGTHYAQARYLLLHLQEEGLLEGFYKAYRANQHADPSGWDSLRAALGEPDMRAFQRGWETWVLGLQFP